MARHLATNLTVESPGQLRCQGPAWESASSECVLRRDDSRTPSDASDAVDALQYHGYPRLRLVDAPAIAKVEAMRKATVMIVEAQPVVSQGLKLALAETEDLCVVGSANSIATARATAEQLRPDVVVVDAQNETDSFEQSARAFGLAPAVILLAAGDDTDVDRARSLGATMLVSRDASLNDLIEAIRRAWHVERSPILPWGRSTASPIPPRSGGLSDLTHREIEILELLVQGLTHKAIANELHVAVNTVRTHTRNIHMKLNVHSNPAAVSFALGYSVPSISVQ
jgi:DNA-binding NarL/FixJ family response regulator